MRHNSQYIPIQLQGECTSSDYWLGWGVELISVNDEGWGNGGSHDQHPGMQRNIKVGYNCQAMAKMQHYLFYLFYSIIL